MSRVVILVYFAFTSLSTVGFGDYYPVSDAERLFGAFILLFGVAIFSYVMGMFIEILSQFQMLNEEIDEGDQLTLFFNLLKKLNGNKPIDFDLQKRVEDFFAYKWKFDKNQAIDDPAEIALLDQIPSEVQDKLYSGFLFNEFL